MGEPKPDLWPRAEVLQALPTLKTKTLGHGIGAAMRKRAQQLGINFQLDLKLVTKDYEYWLCTRGAAERQEGEPDIWVVGYITRIALRPAEVEDECITYGPESVKDQQAWDYLKMLADERVRLKEMEEESPSPENRARIQELTKEMNQVMTRMGILPSPFLSHDAGD